MQVPGPAIGRSVLQAAEYGSCVDEAALVGPGLLAGRLRSRRARGLAGLRRRVREGSAGVRADDRPEGPTQSVAHVGVHAADRPDLSAVSASAIEKIVSRTRNAGRCATVFTWWRPRAALSSDRLTESPHATHPHVPPPARFRRGASAPARAARSLLALAVQAFALAIPNLTGRAIDEAIGPHDRTELWLWVWLIVGAGLASGALMVARRLIAGRLSLNVEYDLRQSLYTHLQGMSFGFYDKHQTGQLLSRATSDVSAVRMFLGYGLVFITQYGASLIAASVAALPDELAARADHVRPAAADRRSSRPATRGARTPCLRDIQQRIADVTTQRRGVDRRRARRQGLRTGGRRDRALRRAHRARLRARARLCAHPGALQPAARPPAAARVRGHHPRRRAARDRRRPHEGRLLRLQPLPRAADLAAAHDRHVDRPVPARRSPRASASSSCSTSSPRSTIPRRPLDLPEGRGELRFEHVTFGYDAERPVLRDLDLAIAPGSTVAVIGRTGSGKTTLTSLIPRFYDPQGGRRHARRRRRAATLRLGDLRGAIATVAEDTFLFSTTVAGNIAYGGAGRDARADRRGGPQGAGPRLHRGAARGLRHARRASAG